MSGAAELLGLGEELLDFIDFLDESRRDGGIAEERGVVRVGQGAVDGSQFLTGNFVVGIVFNDFIDQALCTCGMTDFQRVIVELEVDPGQALGEVA